MSDTELKPCPFCGGNGYLIGGYSTASTSVYSAFIRCESCQVDGQNGVSLLKDKAKELAVTNWNTRTNEDIKEELKQKIEEVYINGGGYKGIIKVIEELDI